MEGFLGFICQSCHSLQAEDIQPTQRTTLHSSICSDCGQVISAQTKLQQLDDYWAAQPATAAERDAQAEQAELSKIKNRKF